MTDKSLVPILKADKSGQIGPKRTYVVTGIEQHVAVTREGNLPYPQRDITTSRYIYETLFRIDGPLAVWITDIPISMKGPPKIGS